MIGVHKEKVPTLERIATAHSRLPREWHGWHAESADGGKGHFAYYNSREACYICTLLDLIDYQIKQLEKYQEFFNHVSDWRLDKAIELVQSDLPIEGVMRERLLGRLLNIRDHTKELDI